MPLGLISGAEITQCNVPGGSQQLFSDDNRIASDEWIPELGRSLTAAPHRNKAARSTKWLRENASGKLV